MILEKETNLYADNAIARGITDSLLNYDTSLNQLAVFNKLTNNGQIQGLFMTNGDLYMNASHITTGTLAAARIGAHSIAVSKLTGLIQNGNWKIDLDEGTMTIGNISANNITSGTLSVDRISPNSVSVDKLTGQITNSNWNINLTTGTLTIGNISANNITTGTLSASRISGHSLPTSKLSGSIENGNWGIDFDNGTFSIGNISANNITTGTLSASRIGGHSLAASKLTGSISNGNWGIDFDDGTFSIGNISANNITTGTMSANRISGGKLTLGGTANVGGSCEVLADNNTQLGEWNYEGILINNSGRYARMGRMPIDSSHTSWELSSFSVSNTLYWNTRTKHTDISETRVDVTNENSNVYTTIASNAIYISPIDSSYGATALQIHRDTSAFPGDLVVYGVKSRLVKTVDYGNRRLYCYETPSPLFGDVGEGIISDDGKCYVQIDGIFAETVSLNQYQILLQKYSEGDCWVSERKGSYFVVEGTAGLSFGWELKAKQADFSQYRLEKEVESFSATTDNDMDYATELINHITELQEEREVSP